MHEYSFVGEYQKRLRPSGGTNFQIFGSMAIARQTSSILTLKAEIAIRSPLVMMGDRVKWRQQQFDALTF